MSVNETEGKKSLSTADPKQVKQHFLTFKGASCCFAGANDELVVAASHDSDLYIWSVPASDRSASKISGM